MLFYLWTYGVASEQLGHAIFWNPRFVYKISKKCYLQNKSTLSAEFAKKRLYIFLDSCLETLCLHSAACWNFSGSGKLGIVVEFHPGAFATNKATPPSSNCVNLFSCNLSNFHHLWALGGNIDGGKMCSNLLYIPHSQRYRIGFAQLHIYGHFNSNKVVTNKLNKNLFLINGMQKNIIHHRENLTR